MKTKLTYKQVTYPSGRKTQKIVFLLILTLFAVSLNAQYLFPYHDNTVYGETAKDDLEYIVPIINMGLGFTTNFSMTKTDMYYSWSEKKQRQTTFTVYGTTFVSIVASHYLIKWLETKPFKKQRKNKHYY